MSKKPLIVFEGIEGSGKSYHISNISKYLTKKKIKHIKLREPGGSFNAERIRKLILNNRSNFDKNTDLFLYLAARSENIKLIKKNLGKKIILIDRFVDSTVSYQHYGLGVNLRLINQTNKYLLKDIKIKVGLTAITGLERNGAKPMDLVNFTSRPSTKSLLAWSKKRWPSCKKKQENQT